MIRSTLLVARQKLKLVFVLFVLAVTLDIVSIAAVTIDFVLLPFPVMLERWGTEVAQANSLVTAILEPNPIAIGAVVVAHHCHNATV